MIPLQKEQLLQSLMHMTTILIPWGIDNLISEQ